MSETAANIEPIGKREKTKLANRQAILVAARAVFVSASYALLLVATITAGVVLLATGLH